MQKISPIAAFGALCLVLLPVSASDPAVAQDSLKQSQPVIDLSAFRTIAAETLAIVDTGNLRRAKQRIKGLETSWDRAESKLRPQEPERWGAIDKAIDGALTQLRAPKVQAQQSKDALQNLLASFDRVNKNTAAGGPAAITAAKLSVTDIIAAAEKFKSGATVLDVSFEPKDGQPFYAVRTYVNGKVWDGRFDGTNGTAVDQGLVTQESELDAEDKAEVAALSGAKITLREAIASAEKASGGRALNAGLEQVGGRAVWEILTQGTAQPQQVHVDPITGKIL